MEHHVNVPSNGSRKKHLICAEAFLQVWDCFAFKKKIPCAPTKLPLAKFLRRKSSALFLPIRNSNQKNLTAGTQHKNLAHRVGFPGPEPVFPQILTAQTSGKQDTRTLLYSWFDSILILDLINFHISGTLLGIALTLENNLNKIDIFTILSLLIDEHNIIIHLSRSSLIPLNSVL